MATLSGLERSATRPKGGVRTVRLATTAEVSAAATSPDNDTRSASIASAVEASGASYDFREDGAQYSETLTGDDSQPLVRHTLVMEFPAEKAARSTVDELLAHSHEGFVAVVTRASGEQLLVGYSPRFGAAYPLRVTKVGSTSGSKPADFPALTLTLESIDANQSVQLN